MRHARQSHSTPGRSLLESLECRTFLSMSPNASSTELANVVVPNTPGIVGTLPLTTVTATPISSTGTSIIPVYGKVYYLETGQPFSGTVARLTDTTNIDLSTLTGTIDWGDGTAPSPATFTLGSRGFIRVSGSHQYAAAGTFLVGIDVVENKPGIAPLTLADIKGTDAYVEQHLPARGHDFDATSTQSFSKRIGSFAASLVQGSADSSGVGGVLYRSLTATIHWGDGTESTGVLVSNGYDFHVLGSHGYATPGIYTVRITVSQFVAPPHSLSGPTLRDVADISSTITARGPFTGQGEVNLINEVVNQSFNADLGTFYAGGNLTGPGTETSIDWGDGSSSSGTVQFEQSDLDDHVFGSHTYAKAGDYTIKVEVDQVPVGPPGSFLPDIIQILARFQTTAVVTTKPLVFPPYPPQPFAT